MTVVGKSERQQSKERKAATEGRPPSGERKRTGSREKMPERRPSFQQAISRGKEILGLKPAPNPSAIKNEVVMPSERDESAVE